MAAAWLATTAAALYIAWATPLVNQDLLFLPCNTPYLGPQLVNHQLLIINQTEVCGGTEAGLGSVMKLVLSQSTKAIIGSYPPEYCDILDKAAQLNGVKVVSWHCPQVTGDFNSSVIRLQPKIAVTVAAVSSFIKHFKFRSVSIVSLDYGWWQQLGLLLENTLMKSNFTLKHSIYLSKETIFSIDELKTMLSPLKNSPGRVVLVCLPWWWSEVVVDAISWTGAIGLPSTSLLFFHLLPYLPQQRTRPPPPPIARATLLLSLANNIHCLNQPALCKPVGVTSMIKLSVKMIEGGEVGEEERYWENLVLWDIMDNTSMWRPLLYIEQDQAQNLKLMPLISRSREWARLKSLNHLENNVTCDDEECDFESYGLSVKTIAAATAITLATIAAVVLTTLVRRQFIKSRISKGQCKVLLTSADFVFPQTQDTKRVEEGIEAMLCCWLHQLQGLGAPEIDKPDLLKGSVASLKSTMKTSPSLGSVSKISSDMRARYNGDLVQLKPISSQGGSFELRKRALDHLITLHWLRHENINPLLGCLPDPNKPLLVWEYCSRGSLEDVLMADEIKLDWSFRLSLLTDLVRGMRYLHSSPAKIHGNLTSRNCVIDARWVLKLTDYSLNQFYDAQNIYTTSKSPRELLWVAPEFLRDECLRKKGSQPGDVYSFSIIMQEVVLRGEPYCMLSLPPEEIIEKIKHPPPLIRPSVSKGAAPPEAINIMRQCWAELPDMRPDFNTIHDLFKILNHGRKANFVDTMFQMLEKYSNNLEDLIRERTDQLDMEKKKTEQLLNRMLPSYVAEKLKVGMPVDPEEFREVTIYFSDIVGFTTISAYSTPFEVVDLLNDLYTCFDATINAYNVYKVETIGDAYMVVGGLPIRIQDHAEQIATMALDLLHHSGKFRIRHLPYTPLRLRIGLHTGPCCAGVVGLTMPRYCLFGDTVNTASRMESSGYAWRIHISEATKLKLDEAGGYQIECRGLTELKGKGKVMTYWLLGKTGFDKPLPSPPSLRESHGLDEQLVMYGRTGIMEHLPTQEVAISEALISPQSLAPPSQPAKAKPTYQLSLDAGLLAAESDHSRENKKWRANRQMTFDTLDEPKDNKMSIDNRNPSESDTPYSGSELNVEFLGVSFVNQSKSVQNLTAKQRKVVDENDLSSQYNRYRCISPNDHNRGSGGPSRFLKRQFSVDKEDTSDSRNRLFKQNSAGAANDLGKIEEIPSQSPIFKEPNSGYKHRPVTNNTSAESLT